MYGRMAPTVGWESYIEIEPICAMESIVGHLIELHCNLRITEIQSRWILIQDIVH
jgi:hypothetical protein